MTAAELFERLSPLVAPALEDIYDRRDLCILATRCVLDVCEYFGVAASPLAVRAILYNAAFAARIERGEAEAVTNADVCRWAKEDGSWSVGIGFGPVRPAKWNGHLVAAADGVFGDFSIGAAERVAHGIVTGPALIGPLPAAGPWSATNDEGTTVEYTRIEDAARETFRAAPDWRDRRRRTRIVGALIRYLKGNK